jgi:diguanylate cyclase (GGDEF)-like protein
MTPPSLAARSAALFRSADTTKSRLAPDGSRFNAQLETEFSRQQLAENRTLIRVTSLLAIVLGVPRGVEQIVLGAWTQLQLAQFAAVLASSLVLAALAWGPWFQRAYLTVAQVLVPLRNSLVALTVAGVAARGQMEALMLLPLLVIGPFLVFGLRFNAAATGVAVTLVVYAIACAQFDVALATIIRSCTLLLIVAAACGVVARTLERAARMRFLANYEMAQLAQHDALTGVKNRRVFDEQLERLWQRAVDEDRRIAILLLDVDHFKAYNDHYGHQAGDRALRHVAQVCQAIVTRPQDLVARYGGEEFAVLLYDADVGEAGKLAERMRKAVVGLKLQHTDSRAGQLVTISIGIAIVEPSAERRARGALQLADEALYQAKTHGRNRVEIMGPSAHAALETGVFAKGTGLHG